MFSPRKKEMVITFIFPRTFHSDSFYGRVDQRLREYSMSRNTELVAQLGFRTLRRLNPEPEL